MGSSGRSRGLAWRILAGALIAVMGGVVAATPLPQRAVAAGPHAGLLSAAYKVPDPFPSETAPAAQIALHGARQEYLPFQIVVQAGERILHDVYVSIAVDPAAFDLALYTEHYLPTPDPAQPVIAVADRISGVRALPDGLIPLRSTFDVAAGAFVIVWADLFVRASAPPGDHTVPVQLSAAGGWAETLSVNVRVYPVDLPPTPAMRVVIPLEAHWTIPFYASGDPLSLHLAVNALLREHGLIPGTFAQMPVLAPGGWDFSPLDAELDALPPGATIYAPGPFDLRRGAYLLLNAQGRPYTAAAFDDPVFVAQAAAYFQALADYLRAKGRLADALLYPTDETRWVADEPLHNGPAGYQRLAQWTALIRGAGLRVRASEVLPAAPGPESLGWLPAAAVADDLHVHMDVFDAVPRAFVAWMGSAGQSASVYLNQYGDMIALPPALTRGLIWQAYQYGVRDIAGYAALEWVNRRFNLVDPWAQPERLYPHFEYGGGALIWPPRAPGEPPLPSLRLKLLREGIEDARLLERYAARWGSDAAAALADCLTPGPLAQQIIPAERWDGAHTALLIALSTDQPVISAELCITAPAPAQRKTLKLLTRASRANWSFSKASGKFITAEDDAPALRVTYEAPDGTAGYWFGATDWSAWTALEIEVTNTSPYFAAFDVGLVDERGRYVLLQRDGGLLAPETSTTLVLPLTVADGYDPGFDWSEVSYLELHVATTITRTDYRGVEQTYALGPRTLIWQRFALVR